MNLDPAKTHSLASVPATALLSMIAGAAGMYFTLESRIEKRAAERTTTAIALESLKGQQAKLDSREWDNAQRLEGEMKSLKEECNAVKDRLLKLELSTNHPP